MTFVYVNVLFLASADEMKCHIIWKKIRRFGSPASPAHGRERLILWLDKVSLERVMMPII
jgi:hypothetical protein